MFAYIHIAFTSVKQKRKQSNRCRVNLFHVRIGISLVLWILATSTRPTSALDHMEIINQRQVSRSPAFQVWINQCNFLDPDLSFQRRALTCGEIRELNQPQTMGTGHIVFIFAALRVVKSCINLWQSQLRKGKGYFTFVINERRKLTVKRACSLNSIYFPPETKSLALQATATRK